MIRDSRNSRGLPILQNRLNGATRNVPGSPEMSRAHKVRLNRARRNSPEFLAIPHFAAIVSTDGGIRLIKTARNFRIDGTRRGWHSEATLQVRSVGHARNAEIATASCGAARAGDAEAKAAAPVSAQAAPAARGRASQ